MMLSTVTWTGGGGSNNAWSDPANWSSNPSLPSTGDDVIIGIAGASVTLTDSVTINSLQLQRGATLSDQGGMTVANGLTNSGTITIGSEKGADLQVTSGPLLNEAYGQILCAGQDDDSVHLVGNIENQGTITADQSYLDINIANGNAPTANTFQNTNTIQLNNGANITIVGIAGPSDLGNFQGNGLLVIAAADWSISSNWTVPQPQAGSVWFGLEYSTISAGGTLTNPAGSTFFLMGDSTIDSAVVNQGTLCAGVDSTINGQLTAPSGSTLEVGAGSVPFIYDVPTSALNLDITQGFTNHGQIDLYNVSLGSTLTVTNGALLNAADGTIDSLPGLGTQGLANTLDADLDNQGAINVTGADLAINPSTGTPADTPTDTGRTTVSAGRLLINSANALSDDGSLSIGAGGTFIFDPSITAANAAATAPNGTPVAKPQLPPAMPRNQSVLHRTIGSGLLPSPQSVPSSSSHTPAVDQAVRSSFAPRAAGSPAWLGQTATSSENSDQQREKGVAILALDAVFARYGQ